MVSNIIDITNMSIQESQCFTVIDRLQLREQIKVEAVRIITQINKKTGNHPKHKIRKLIDIKNAMDSFKYLMKDYKNAGEQHLY